MSCGAFNEQDIEEAFTYLEQNGLPMFDAREVRATYIPMPVSVHSPLMPMVYIYTHITSLTHTQLYPCEEFLGEMLAHWKKRQLKLQNDVKQVRPFIATR